MEFQIKLAEDNPLGRAGQRVTLALQPADVHDPTELPTYLAGYKPFGFRADEVSKPVLVDNDSDKYRTFNSDDAFEPVEVKGSESGAVPEVDPKSALLTYKVVERYIGSFIPKQTELATGNNYNPLMAAGRRARTALELDREIDTMTLVGTNTNWDSTVRLALGATQKWNGGAISDPILDLQTALETSWQQVTEIWMNQRVAHAMLRHDKVRDHMRQFLGDAAVSAALGRVSMAGTENVDFAIPGFPPFRVAAAKYKVAGVMTYVLGDVVVLVRTPPGVPTDGEDIAATYTFRRRGPSGTGFEVREFFVEGRGPLGGTMVVVSQADIAIMTGNVAGGIITGAYA